MERVKAVDNIKGGLIFLVVWGHFIERFYSQNNIYNCFIHDFIYSFHMPAFILISGMFTYKILNKDNLQKIFASTIAPIIVFEIIYRISLRNMLLSNLIPYIPTWVLWFLMSLLWWRLLTPYLLKTKFPIFCSLILLALVNLIVMHNNARVFSILRTFNFLPFYVIGTVYKDNILKVIKINNSKLVTLVLPIIFFILAGFIIYFFPKISSQLYSSLSFYTLRFNYFEGLWRRLAIDILSLLAIFSFILLAKNMNFLNKFGKNSLYIYLWHAMFIFLYDPVLKSITLGKYQFLLNTNSFLSVSIVFILAVIVTYIFSQNFVKKVTDYMFSKVNKLLRLEV